MNRKTCMGIHETVIRDVIEIFDDLQDIDPEKMVGKDRSATSFSSLPKATSNLTLTFPAITSTNASIETQVMIAKAHERKCVAMLQMLFSAYQLSNADNAAEYIRQFHTNLDGKIFSVDDFINLASGMNESTGFTVDHEAVAAIKKDMANLGYILPSSVNETSINDYKVISGVQRKILKEADDDDRGSRLLSGFLDRSAINKNAADYRKSYAQYFQNQVLNSDIKKANELMPTLMTINYYSTNAVAGQAVPIRSVVIGVKCKLVPIDSDDIINHVVSKTQDRNWVTNLIRATTRDISFWKDFMFAVDKAKIDALSLSRRGSSSKMWKVLERRATKSKLRRILGSKNDATAITIICMTQNEVEYVRKNENINLEDEVTIRHLMESLNLMGFVIVDESLEVAKFLYDTGDDNWETISFSHLEREASDNTYKKVVNLMTKYNR